MKKTTFSRSRAWRRFSAGFVASAMMLGMTATPAFAAGYQVGGTAASSSLTNSIKNVDATVTVTINEDGTVTAPSTSLFSMKDAVPGESFSGTLNVINNTNYYQKAKIGIPGFSKNADERQGTYWQSSDKMGTLCLYTDGSAEYGFYHLTGVTSIDNATEIEKYKQENSDLTDLPEGDFLVFDTYTTWTQNGDTIIVKGQEEGTDLVFNKQDGKLVGEIYDKVFTLSDNGPVPEIVWDVLPSTTMKAMSVEENNTVEVKEALTTEINTSNEALDKALNLAIVNKNADNPIIYNGSLADADGSFITYQELAYVAPHSSTLIDYTISIDESAGNDIASSSSEAKFEVIAEQGEAGVAAAANAGKINARGGLGKTGDDSGNLAVTLITLTGGLAITIAAIKRTVIDNERY